MSRFNTAILLGALSAALCACPPATTPDGGKTDFDAGNPTPVDACSGGCAANQICNTQKKICEDACGSCDAGNCTRVGPNQFQCVVPAVTCQGSVCEPGQVACLGGACACLVAARGIQDTCQPEGKWCNGGVCGTPKRWEECIPGGAPCGAGELCEPVFGDVAICVKDCGAATGGVCDRGEGCAGLSDTTAGCLPLGLFSNQECNQHVSDNDGGWQTADGGGLLRRTVPPSNTCLVKDSSANITDPAGLGTGNCTYAIFRFWDDGIYPYRTCRPPGQALEGQPCRDDFSTGAIGTQCSTGLECVKTQDDQGVCMRMCNANPPRPGFTPTPSCGTGESCVNVYRYTDPSDNSVLGVCMKGCNVFDPATSTCANVGTQATSCVPSTADGQLLISLDGSGICMPQKPTVVSPYQACTETDPFRGAACSSAHVCTSLDNNDPAACVQTCDMTCVVTDGGVAPTRCATQPNGACPSGKSCRQVTSTRGARVGFCL